MIALLIIGCIVAYLVIGMAMTGLMAARCQDCAKKEKADIWEHFGWVVGWPVWALAIPGLTIFYTFAAMHYMAWRLGRVMGGEWQREPVTLERFLDAW